MIVRTCLLISDDPDDHIEFSEALYDVSDDTVLLAVANMKKAVDLLALRHCIPECIFLNVGIADVDLDLLFSAIDAAGFSSVRVIAYGEPPELIPAHDKRIAHYLDNDLSYSGLKNHLKELLGNHQ